MHKCINESLNIIVLECSQKSSTLENFERVSFTRYKFY